MKAKFYLQDARRETVGSAWSLTQIYDLIDRIELDHWFIIARTRDGYQSMIDCNPPGA